MRPRFAVSVVSAAWILAMTASQAGNTGTLVVRAQDASGLPVPGAIVQITNTGGLPVPAARTTDGAGTATFLLGSGSGYTVTVSGAGFTTQSQEFELGLAKSKIILFKQSRPVQESVEVRARIVQLDEGGEQKVTFSNTFFEDLPLFERSYQNVLKLAPGINDANGDGNPNVHGSRERDFKATVDGVSNVDPLTGNFMASINPDAIEEIEIVTTGASAEYGGATGGFGRILTKQGTNMFDGTSSIYLRSSFLDGDTVSPDTEVSYHDVRPTLNVTGPFVKDRLFFALFHEYIDQGRPQNFLDGTSLVVVSKGSRNLDKLTWQAGPRNKLMFQVQSDPLRTGPLGLDSRTDVQSGYDYKQGGGIFQIHWDTQLSAILNVQSLVGMSRTGISLTPVTDGVKNDCVIDTYAAIGARLDAYGNLNGPSIDEDYCLATLSSRRSGSYLQKYSDERVRLTAKSDISYYLHDFLGIAHTLRAGVLIEKKRFASRDRFRAFSSFELSLARDLGAPDPDPGGAGVLTRQVYIPGLPDTVENHAEGSTYALYIENQFRPRPSISLRVGVRAEQEILQADGFQHFDPAREDREFTRGYKECVAANPNNQVVCATSNFHWFHTYEFFPAPGTAPIRSLINDPRLGIQSRQTERFRISNTNIAPRLSVSWDPGSTGKTKLFGTAGRYYGETFLLVPLFELPPDSFLFSYMVDGVMSCAANPDGDGTTCTVSSQVQDDGSAKVSPASIRQVDRDLRTPYQDEYTVGISREILSETSVTVTYIRRKYRDLFQDVDRNHFSVDLGSTWAGCRRNQDGGYVPRDPKRDGEPDDCGGRIVVIEGPPPFNIPTIREIPDGVPDLRVHNPFFNQVNQVGNFNRADYKAYQLELKRRLHRHWEMEASYVWSEAVGNAEDYNLALGSDPTTVQDEFGYLDYDQRHVVKLNVAVQFPVWNLRLASAASWQSGRPYSITEQHASYDQLRGFGPFRIAYFQNRSSYPTRRRNDQRNESFTTVDMGARKDFALGKTTLVASLDVFNLLNNYTPYISGVRNSEVLTQLGIGRQFQVGAKVTF